MSLVEGPSLSLFLLHLLLFLFPVAVYCLVLAAINRRPHPTLVPGSWDFVGLLFAASGFLLFALPTVLQTFFQRLISETPFGEDGPSPDAVGSMAVAWWIAYLGYYFVVVAGSLALTWLRASRTVVYNITPDELDHALDRVLARLHLPATRTGRRLFLGFGIVPASKTEAPPDDLLTAMTVASPNGGVEQSPARSTPLQGEAIVDVDVFPSLWNATLHWRSDTADLRRDVEAELAQELKGVQSYDSPVGTWLLGVGGFLFALVFMIVVALILGLLFPPRR